MTFEEELLQILNQIPPILEKAFTEAWIERHGTHNQKRHGRRYGAGGDLLPKGHKRGDAVKGGGKAAATRKEKTGGGQGGFPKGDEKSLSRQYKDLDQECLNLNDPGCVALNAYTSFNYETINSGLRKGKLGKEDKKIAQEVDRMLDKAPRTESDMTVSRSISPDVFNKLMKEGTVFEDKAFVSTTVGDKIDIGELNLEIRIPKGSKGAYVAGLSEYPDEKEFLLPRGSQFKVTSVSNGKAVLELVS